MPTLQNNLQYKIILRYKNILLYKILSLFVQHRWYYFTLYKTEFRSAS